MKLLKNNSRKNRVINKLRAENKVLKSALCTTTKLLFLVLRDGKTSTPEGTFVQGGKHEVNVESDFNPYYTTKKGFVLPLDTSELIECAGCIHNVPSGCYEQCRNQDKYKRF